MYFIVIMIMIAVFAFGYLIGHKSPGLKSELEKYRDKLLIELEVEKRLLQAAKELNDFKKECLEKEVTNEVKKEDLH